MNIRCVKPWGFSLVGLMIGILVAMIAVLGMMSLYRTLVRNTVESNADIRATGDRSLALLMAHLHLHDAGYGITSGGDDLRLCSGATFDAQANTLAPSGCTPLSGPGPWLDVNTLLWRFDPDRDGVDPFCAGLHSSAQGFHYLLPTACGTGWPASWPAQRLLNDSGGQPPVTLSVERFSTAASACRALGAACSGGIAVTLGSEHTGSGTTLASTTCIVNFPAENPP